MAGDAPMCANKDILSNAVNSKELATLVAVVKAAGSMQGNGVVRVDRVMLPG